VWDFVKSFFVPAPVAADRPQANSEAGRYVRSFLIVRLMIGVLGVGWPLLLVSLDKWFYGGHPGSRIPRDSLSVYYYSGMREGFTVILGVIAFFLFTYKLTERNLDNTLSMVAGLAGMTIPFFPTGRPSDITPAPALNPLQNAIGEDWAKWVHFGASAVFIAALGGVCLLFGHREGERGKHGNLLPRRFWRGYHFLCAGAIGLAALWIVATTVGHDPLIHGPYWSLLLGEWVATWAFGFSWFAKGAEIRYLFGFDEPQPSPAAAPVTSPN
jgi:multisubunit Na+/H+ antiporter MnhB subunit